MFLHGSLTQGQETLLAQVKGSLKSSHGLQLAMSGDLRHSMTSLNVLPTVLGPDGLFGQSGTLIQGRASDANVNYNNFEIKPLVISFS